MLTPLKRGLISNSECLLSASALSNIAAHSSKVLSILKVNTEVIEQDIKKGANFSSFYIAPYVEKERKKAITSTIALLIGWPVGLDQFLEGNNGKGIQSIAGWLVVGSTFLIGAGFLGTGDDSGFGFWIITALGGLVGTVCILTKLIAKLKAFEEAED